MIAYQLAKNRFIGLTTTLKGEKLLHHNPTAIHQQPTVTDNICLVTRHKLPPITKHSYSSTECKLASRTPRNHKNIPSFIPHRGQSSSQRGQQQRVEDGILMDRRLEFGQHTPSQILPRFLIGKVGIGQATL